MNFCSKCGRSVEKRYVESDQRDRDYCPACDIYHYVNPKILVSCMVECGSKIVMMRRAHDPSYGLWSPPAGFAEQGETLEAAAMREAREEANAIVDPDSLRIYNVTDLKDISEVYVGFVGSLANDDIRPGPEALEVGLFDENDLPWDKLAFPAMRGYLKLYFEERAKGEIAFHQSRADKNRRARVTYSISKIYHFGMTS